MSLLKLFGPPTVEKLKAKGNLTGLIQFLNHQDWWERQAAAQALGELKDKRAVEPLLAMLKIETTFAVIRTVVQALGRIGDARAVNPLVEILMDSGNQHIQIESALAINQIGVQYLSDDPARELVTKFCEEKLKQDESSRYWENRALQRKAELEEARKVSDELQKKAELEEARKVSEKNPCEKCKQHLCTCFSFYFAKMISQTSKVSGTFIITRTTNTTYELAGAQEVWLCNDCLNKKGLQNTRDG